MAEVQSSFKLVIQVTGAPAAKQQFDQMAGAVEGAEKKVNSAADGVAQGSGKFREAFTEIAASVAIIDGPLGGIASRITAFSTVVRGGLGVGLLVAGVAGIGAALNKGVMAAEAYESAIGRVDKILKVTGNSAGVTAFQVEQWATAVRDRTGAVRSELLTSAAALASYANITGDNFRKSLELAADAQKVFGGALEESAARLGEILASPADGFEQLTEMGVVLTKSQEELVKKMQDVGDIAGAQALILDELKNRYGGVGTTNPDSLTGAIQAATAAVEDFWIALGQTEAGEVFKTTAREVVGIFTTITNLIKDREVSSKSMLAITQEIAELEKQRAEYEKIGDTFAVDQINADIAAKTQELRGIEEQLAQADSRAGQAQVDSQRVERDRQTKEVQTQIKAVKEEIFKLDNDDLAVKAKQVEKEKERLKTLLDKGKIEKATYDEAVKAQDELLAAERRKAAKEEEESNKGKRDQNATVVEDLRREVEARRVSERELAIETELRKLNAEATAEQIAQVRELAGKKYDLIEALKAQEQAEKDLLKDQMKTGEFLLELDEKLAAARRGGTERDRFIAENLKGLPDRALAGEMPEAMDAAKSGLGELFDLDMARDLTEQYDVLRTIREQMLNLDRLYKEGRISAKVYSEAHRDAMIAALLESDNLADGVQAGFLQVARDMETGAEMVASGIQSMAAATTDAVADFFMTGEFNVRKFTESILRDLARIAAQRVVLSAFTSFMGGFADGGVFDKGQVVDRFQRGGVVTGPTLFPMANGMGLMGEAGPEAVMPLKRGADGKLGVSGGGGTQQFNFAFDVKVEGGGGGMGQGQDGERAGEAMARAAYSKFQEMLMREKGPGGILYRGY